MQRLNSALKSFLDWVVRKFIEDDERWLGITEALVEQLTGVIEEQVPNIIDLIRSAIHAALTGEELEFVDDQEIDDVEPTFIDGPDAEFEA